MEGRGVDERLLLRPREAAKLLNISKTKLYELLAVGAIPSIKLAPRVTRIPRRALEELATQAVHEWRRGGAA